MGMMRTLSRRGDDRVTWDTEKFTVGDPEAEAAVREAEQIFKDARDRGCSAFKVNTDKTTTRINTFDPLADQIILVPRIIGG